MGQLQTALARNPARFAVLTQCFRCTCLDFPRRGLASSGKLTCASLGRSTMATDIGVKKQRSEAEAASLTPSERTEGIATRHSGRTPRSYFPSVFSVSPGEFFTMSPITLMRRFTEDIDRAFSGAVGDPGRGSSNRDVT